MLANIPYRIRGGQGCGAIVPLVGDEIERLSHSDYAGAYWYDLALQSGGGDSTFPADGPVERIDYIFGVGVVAAQGRVVASTASDHRAVVVMVTLSGR